MNKFNIETSSEDDFDLFYLQKISIILNYLKKTKQLGNNLISDEVIQYYFNGTKGNKFTQFRSQYDIELNENKNKENVNYNFQDVNFLLPDVLIKLAKNNNIETSNVLYLNFRYTRTKSTSSEEIYEETLTEINNESNLDHYVKIIYQNFCI